MKERMTMFPFLLVAAGSVAASLAFMVWLICGFGGFFWIAYGHAQTLYFLIVAGTMMIVLCGARYVQLRAPAIIVGCVLSGYAGSFIAYVGFSFTLIMRAIGAGNYLLLIRPFIFPFHLVFILAGLCAGLLVYAISKTQLVRRVGEDDADLTF